MTAKKTKHTEYRPLTIGDLEKKSGTKLDASSNTKATVYLKDKGLPSLAKVLARAERRLAK